LPDFASAKFFEPVFAHPETKKGNRFKTCFPFLWLPKLEVIRNEHYQEIMEMSHLLAGMQRYFPMLKANTTILH